MKENKTDIVWLILQYNNWNEKQRLWLFLSLLDLHCWKDTVDEEMKKFEKFIEKQRSPLKTINEQKIDK